METLLFALAIGAMVAGAVSYMAVEVWNAWLDIKENKLYEEEQREYRH